MDKLFPFPLLQLMTSDILHTYQPSREIQGFYIEYRYFLAKSRDFESIYVVIDILLNVIDAKYMDNLLQKYLKHVFYDFYD